MNTLLLEVDNHPQQGDKYLLRLWLLTAAGRAAQPEAEAIIPRSLKLPEQTLDPIAFPNTLLTDIEDSPDFELIGEHLFQLLSLGQVGARWQQLRKGRTRTLLEIKPDELQFLPWELLSRAKQRLALGTMHTFLRAAGYSAAPPAAPPSWPLRLLIVIGAEADDEAVQAEEECRQIEEALRHLNRVVDVEVLRRPTHTELMAKYEDFLPHILHFIGHGDEEQGEGRLRFDTQPPWYWGEGDVRNDLENVAWDEEQGMPWIPRFVFLNACRTGSQPGARGWSVGRTFRELGVPATLTMQGDVQGRLAGMLAGELYKELAAGRPLDVALAHARTLVRQQPGIKINHREWALPCLTVTQPPEQLFSLRPALTNDEQLKIEQCETLKEVVAEFVDRSADRRKILHGLCPIRRRAVERILPHLVVVRGVTGVGKSWIARWCLEAFAWQRHNVRYVEVVGTEGKEWLDLLLQIRDGDPAKRQTSFIHDRLPDEAFRQFNWALQHRLLGREPEVWNGQPVAPPQKDRPLGAYSHLPEKFAENTFASFREALALAAGDQPLTLVLDHFSNNDKAVFSPAHMREYLRPLLIEEVSKGALSQLRLVLILTEDEYKDYEMKFLEGRFHLIELGKVARRLAQDEPHDREYERLAREFFQRRSARLNKNTLLDETVANFIKSAASGKQPWLPADLKDLYTIAEKLFGI